MCVCVCARSCSRECTCVRMCTCHMCGHVGTCAMVHIKVKGTTSGVGPCLLPGLRCSACAWLLPPSPHRNTRTADTQWCAWIFMGPGESVLCLQGKQFITELSSQPALGCSVQSPWDTLHSEPRDHIHIINDQTHLFPCLCFSYPQWLRSQQDSMSSPNVLLRSK